MISARISKAKSLHGTNCTALSSHTGKAIHIQSKRKLAGTPLTSRVPVKRLPPPRSSSGVKVNASFLGVGAPEAILVGVVALIVFGPKGLAQAAKSLGSTLRAFQPTIRELTQVSNELKSTLEQEIGLDEIRSEFSKPAVPKPLPRNDDVLADDGGDESEKRDGLSSMADTLNDSFQGAKDAAAAVIDPDIERKRAEAERIAWGGASPARQEGSKKLELEEISMADLEAELMRRKSAIDAGQVPRELNSDQSM